MLTELYIKNFAIIDELRVALTDGLNVLTGETGAGKSIIIDALGATLGQKVGADVVRSGADQAVVEAVFAIPEGPADGNQTELLSMLSDQGLEAEEGQLILSREVNRASGRTAARVNGRSVPLSTLQRIGELLVDIHGQSEHLSLLRVREHIDYLDRYAGLLALRDEVAAGVKDLRAVRAEIEQLVRDEREATREADLLGYQMQEIGTAALQEGEEEALLAERQRLRNAERLRELAHSIHQLIGGEEDSPGAMDLLAQAERQYQELAHLDSSMEADRQSLESARYAVEEAASRARDYLDAIEEDPARLQEVEDRLELISQLKRKYGGSITEILKYAKEAGDRAERLSN
ncbi:MAG TPA: AAA family ATPase, partial [Chloroflexota bacterium]